MLNLTSTSDKLQVVTGSAVATDMHASYLEVDGSTNPSTITPKSAEALAIATATTTDLVAAPGVSTTQRLLKTLNIRNTHASSAQTVTVQKVNGSGTATLHKCTLLAGEVLQWTPDDGWSVIDATGSKKLALSGTGRFLKRTVILNGTTSFTTTTQTNSIIARGQAAGGGGGGIATATSAGGGGGGGSAGGYWEKNVAVTPNTAYTCAVGAKGTGGSAGANNGTAGGDTTLTVGATTYTAKGGPGGIGATAVNGVSINLGGAGPAISTNGDVNGGGEPGAPGMGLSATVVKSGQGGTSAFGGAGASAKTQGAGAAAIGFGSGGAGACLINGGASVAGGNGGDGVLIIDEYA